MSAVRGVPPGRAGRVWLSRRLDTARRGADVLDRKMRILRRERDRFRARADRAELRWTQALGGAETWALRAALLAGAGALRPVDDGTDAGVHVQWSAVMGARFPSAVECVLAPREPRGWLPASSAVTCATVAYRDALTAAVEAAVALAAARVIDDELAATRARARALEDRWVPDLARALAALNLALAEAESAESARLRLAVEAAAPRPRPGRSRRTSEGGRAEGGQAEGGRHTADDGGGEVG